MPDWKRLVEQQLAALNLPPAEKEEVIAELAAHLEDSADAGTSASSDEKPMLAQVPWPRLCRAIERTKRGEEQMNRLTKALLLSIALVFPAGLVLLFLGRAAVVQLLIWIACTAMLLCAAALESNRLNQRTKSLWLPALTTFFGASVSLMACEFLHMQPRVLWVARIGIWLYWPWLASLPVFGAAGAFLSQRAHGAAAARLTACYPVRLSKPSRSVILTLFCKSAGCGSGKESILRGPPDPAMQELRSFHGGCGWWQGLSRGFHR